MTQYIVQGGVGNWGPFRKEERANILAARFRRSTLDCNANVIEVESASAVEEALQGAERECPVGECVQCDDQSREDCKDRYAALGKKSTPPCMD